MFYLLVLKYFTKHKIQVLTILETFQPGWRPGAVSKHLLKKLNKAKNRSAAKEQSAPIKKQKKQVTDKPTLIISKCNGEYIVEMQAEGDKRKSCNPLMYKITTADNQEKVKAKARKERRLVRRAVGSVWSDPYNPEACTDTCYKVYKQAIGFDPFNPCNPECVCPDEYVDDLDSCSCSDDMDIDSEASSLEVDWEINFTPPNAFLKQSQG